MKKERSMHLKSYLQKHVKPFKKCDAILNNIEKELNPIEDTLTFTSSRNVIDGFIRKSDVIKLIEKYLLKSRKNPTKNATTIFYLECLIEDIEDFVIETNNRGEFNND